MNRVDEIVAGAYSHTLKGVSRRKIVRQRASVRIASALPLPVRAPIESTEWRLLRYTARTAIDPKKLVAERIPMHRSPVQCFVERRLVDNTDPKCRRRDGPSSNS